MTYNLRCKVMLCFARSAGLHHPTTWCLYLLLLATGTGCNELAKRHSLPETISNEDVVTIQPLVHSHSFAMRNVDTVRQLAGGVYGVENDKWRWTAGTFGVVLATPPGAATHGADLVFVFYIPDSILHRIGSVNLTAYLNQTETGVETYRAVGTQRFSARIPPELLRRSPVAIEFHLDPYVASGVLDNRELGVVAESVGLQSK